MSQMSGPRVVETHVSVLFFVGERVYKLKKPVSLGFVDLTTMGSRRVACAREVELNRRLAPDVYLGVATVSGADGEPCEHLVVMRRMPDDRRLSHLLGSAAARDALDGVARQVASLHAGSPRTAQIDSAGSPDSVERAWLGNLEELDPYVGEILEQETVEKVRSLVARYLAGRSDLLLERVSAGRIVDGHGDLRSDDVFCLEDGPRILDCVEFDDRLRYVDGLSDVAFLAMDLERLGHPELAEHFVGAYREMSGDPFPGSLLDHYVAYRALVRSKVACIREVQAGGSADEARALLRLCLGHLEASEVQLVLVGGLPGTGKSALATGLADSKGWVLERSDVVRKELAGLPPTSRQEAPYGEGLYSEEMTDATYAELLRRAGAALRRGESVVIDASWTADRRRKAASELASETSSRLVELCCDAPLAVMARRIAERRERADDPSDADLAIAEAMDYVRDPWPGAFPIHTTEGREEALEEAIDVLPVRRYG